MNVVNSTIRKYFAVAPFRRLMHRHMILTLLVAVSRLASLGASISTPLVTRFMIDSAISQNNADDLGRACVLLGIILLVSFAMAIITSYLGTRLDRRIEFDLRTEIQKKWTKLPLSYFTKFGIGDYIYRTTTDVANVVSAISSATLDSVIVSLQLIAYLILAIHLHPGITSLFIVALPGLIVVEIFHSRALRPIQGEVQRLSAEANNVVSQYASGAKTIKVFCLERQISFAYVSKLAQIVRVSMNRWGVDAQYSLLEWLLNTLWGWGLVVFGLFLVIKGNMTLGTLIALKMYLSSLTEQVQQLGVIVRSVVVASISSERLSSIINWPEEQQGAQWTFDHPNAEGCGESLIFDSVKFGYDKSHAVLKSVSFSLPSRGIIGIVGASGSGKTTLISLLYRLYEPDSGCISFYGENIHNLTIRALRDNVSIAEQDTFLLCGSVRENIAMGKLNVPLECIIKSAKAAEAHNFILEMKDGYDTQIGQLGVALSTGQKQRIGIARALLKSSRMLIIDEALNSIDEVTRSRIVEALIQESRNRAVLYITHDIVTLNMCDVVLTVEEGKVFTKVNRCLRVCY